MSVPPSACCCGDLRRAAGSAPAGVAGRLEIVAHDAVERQHDDVVGRRPLHQHLARLFRREQELRRRLQLLLALVFHRAGEVEAERRQRRLAQRLLVEVERLADHRRLRHADRRHQLARIEIPVRLGRGLDRRAAKRQPPAGVGDALAHRVRLQIGEQVGEEFFDLRPAAVVDEAERRIADGDAVGRIDRRRAAPCPSA